MLLMVRKGFAYRFDVNIYAFRLAFSSKQPKIWCKLRFYARHIHFVCIYNLARFASKLTLARIDFLQPGGHLVDKKPLIMLKILLKRRQKSG